MAAPAPAALAHDNLLDTVPGADETVAQLDDVALTFSGELIDFSQASFAQVQGPDGLFYESSCSTIDRNILTTPVALGEPGVYTVLWNAVSSDGHPISESFTFTYAPTGIEPGLGWDKPACGNEQSRIQPAKASPSAAPTTEPPAADTPAPVVSAGDNEVASIAIPLIIAVAVIGAAVITATVVVRQVKKKKRNGLSADAHTDPKE
ncbi:MULTISPECIES: copper resistance CopC family protein [unclassified Microbacterium]|uniref:copper resistance CopC family protein n=1 Tax=unclassified Microbacterium TaxID=2609290 RepID=UPI00144444C9|nr:MULTISPECIES: copper resistance CopC family protein [unclassified Microbacterium]